jgi:hypothetical protein
LKYVLAGIVAVVGVGVWMALRDRPMQEKSPPMASKGTAASATVSVWLAYPRADLTGLDSVRLEVHDRRDEISTWAKTIVAALTVAPNSGVAPLFSPGAAPTSVFLDERQNLHLDFPSDILSSVSAGVEMETLTIQALLKSIGATMPDVKGLKILADGADRETLFGHVDIRRFFPVRQLSGD